eukprot:1156026-Pelagomonas_calceolata.AAC.8
MSFVAQCSKSIALLGLRTCTMFSSLMQAWMSRTNTGCGARDDTAAIRGAKGLLADLPPSFSLAAANTCTNSRYGKPEVEAC